MTIEELEQYVSWDTWGNVVLDGDKILNLPPIIAISILREATKLSVAYKVSQAAEHLLLSYKWTDYDFEYMVNDEYVLSIMQNAHENPFIVRNGYADTFCQTMTNYQEYLAERSMRVKMREARHNIPRALRNQIKERDKGICRYCGIHTEEHFEIDHIIPHCCGGLTTIDNLVLACHQCNAHKRDKSLAITGMTLRPTQ